MQALVGEEDIHASVARVYPQLQDTSAITNPTSNVGTRQAPRSSPNCLDSEHTTDKHQHVRRNRRPAALHSSNRYIGRHRSLPQKPQTSQHLDRRKGYTFWRCFASLIERRNPLLRLTSRANARLTTTRPQKYSITALRGSSAPP